MGGRYKFLRVASYREREHSAADRIPNSAMSAILMQFRYVVISVGRKQSLVPCVFPIFLMVKPTVTVDGEYFHRITDVVEEKRVHQPPSSNSSEQQTKSRAERVLQTRCFKMKRRVYAKPLYLCLR